MPSLMPRRAAISLLRSPSPDEPREFGLPRGQHARAPLPVALAGEQPLQGPARDPVVEPLPARLHRPDAPDQRLGPRLLEHDPADAEADRLEQPVLVQLAGEDDRARARGFLGDAPQDLHPAEPRHAQVEDQDVGTVLPGRPQRRLPVRATRRHLHVRLLPEKAGERVEHERVVVGENETDGHVRSPQPGAGLHPGREPAAGRYVERGAFRSLGAAPGRAGVRPLGGAPSLTQHFGTPLSVRNVTGWREWNVRG